ncbi:MAG: arginase family protein [Bacteroidales bacterium]|nr:arginase family protein [Bacteroidales bacterium]
MKRTLILIFLLFVIKSTGMAQEFIDSDGRIKVLVVKNNYEGPETIYNGGLKDILSKYGDLVQSSTAKLTEAEENEYGEWNRAAIESRSIGNLISVHEQNDYFTLGLLKNCSDLIGMLAGLQNMSPDMKAKDSRNLQNSGLAGNKPLKIGLVWIDAHADFNTPETSLSGMHGGMPVAIAAGMCLTRLRLKSGLDPALPTKYITMACLRDVDPLEQELLDRSQCDFISVNDVRNLTDNLTDQIERLAGLTDLIYVHIDMDVLDPAEVSGHPLTAPEGPTSVELAKALELMFSNDKCNALGIASMPYGKNDPEGLSLKATYNLIGGALKGVSKR